MKPFLDTFYMAWAIAQKDIGDALKNKNIRTNIILIVGVVMFFYWGSTIRPFDKRIDVAVYDEGSSSLTIETTELTDGYTFRFYKATSVQEMETMMGYKQLGVVVPADFDQILASGGEPTLSGYILWVHRARATELGTKYSAKFSELLGQPVRVEIGENFVIPNPDVETSGVHFHLLYATLFMAITTIPYLMMEEKRTQTLDALLVSPAGAGQVVLGKALAGLFYVLVGGGLFFALNWAYVTNWGLALLAFLSCAMFSIGLALAMGSFIQSRQHMVIWMLPVIFFLIIPALFSQEPNLAPGLKAVFSWLPTSAMVRLFQFSMSSSAPLDQLFTNLAIALVSTVLIFAAVVWKVRRSDR
ncbi:MAG: ABC transporter permease [Gammaproteobacteria bacterium]|nr:ABC transporter permease [Gammaproteobacteria bacterium]